MIVISDVIAHLRAVADAPWIDVKEVSDFSMLNTARSGLRGITLFVFTQSESVSADVRGSGPYLQTVTETLGVVIVAKVINDDKFDFSSVRKALRKQLFGWSPDADHESFWLGAGRLLDIQRGQVAWLDNYVTEYTEDQNSYGS